MLDKTDKTYAATLEKLAYSKDPDAHDASAVLNNAHARYALNGFHYRRAVLGGLTGAYVVGMSFLGFQQPLLKYGGAAAGVAVIAMNIAAAQGPRRRRKDARSEIESIAIELVNKERNGSLASDPSTPTTIPAGRTLDATVKRYS